MLRFSSRVLSHLACKPYAPTVGKLLVHRSARRRGIAQLLMEGAEAAARAEGKTLLVLDTVTGDDAERLYERLGWIPPACPVSTLMLSIAENAGFATPEAMPRCR